MRLLVIEDEPGIAKLIRVILAGEGYTVDHASTGEQGFSLALINDYDGILLDLGLGDRHGITVLQDLRREGIATPVLVLTAETSEATLVRALDAGADEYVVKPPRNREIAARVRALVRRRDKPNNPEVLSLGSLSLNRIERRAWVRRTQLNLSPKEFALLEYLMRYAGQVVTRPSLLEHVWDMPFDPGSNLVDVHVKRLRRKLELADSPVRIETRRGAGFALTLAPSDPSDALADLAQSLGQR